MRNILALTILTILCIVNFEAVFANEAVERKTPIEKKQVAIDKFSSSEECIKLKKSIDNDISDLGTCFSDAECAYMDFKCPWNRLCTPTIVSKSEKEDNTAVWQKIFSFQKTCPEYAVDCKQKFAAMNIKKGSLCRSQPELFCISGQCVTSTHVIIQRIGTEDAVDIFGSKASTEATTSPKEKRIDPQELLKMNNENKK